jgi:hypothetical protein
VSDLCSYSSGLPCGCEGQRDEVREIMGVGSTDSKTKQEFVYPLLPPAESGSFGFSTDSSAG